MSAAISGGVPREILRRWLAREFEMVVSYDLLLELETVLLRPKFRKKLSGRRVAYFPAEPNVSDDSYEFSQAPDVPVGVLANSIGGGEEIDLEIPTDALWGVKGFAAPQEKVNTEAGELAWTAPWTRLVAVDLYHLSYFEDPERARAEASEEVEPYVRRQEDAL